METHKIKIRSLENKNAAHLKRVEALQNDIANSKEV